MHNGTDCSDLELQRVTVWWESKMEVRKLFWLLGEQNLNYDKMPSRGVFLVNISGLYLNEVKKYMSW
jgi:hypothetical protein